MLDHEFLGSPARAWILAGAAAVLTYAALTLVRRVLVERLAERAQRTATFADDWALEVARYTRPYFLVALAVFVGLRALHLPPGARTFVHRTLIFVVLLQIGLWATRLVTLWVDRFAEQRTLAGDVGSITTVRALGFAGKALLWMVLAITALETVFDYDVTALVTGLGIAGIAVALAVQNVLGDLLAALSIVLDKPFVVGDFIVVGDAQGTVEQIGLKTTRLRSLGGEQLVFSNAELLKSTIRNFKRMYERRVVLSFEVHLDTPHAALAGLPAAIREIVLKQSPIRFDRAHIGGITDRSFRLETVYYMLDPDYTRHMDVQQRIILEVLAHLDAVGVRLARTLLEEKVVVQ